MLRRSQPLLRVH